MSDKKISKKNMRKFKERIKENDSSDFLDIPICNVCGYSDIAIDKNDRNICMHCGNTW